MDAMGNPTLAGTGISSHPEMVRELGKALSPLLDAALQARDWRTRDSLQDVDACSILLQAVSHHLECCSIAKLLPFLGENLFSCLRASGVTGETVRPSTPPMLCSKPKRLLRFDCHRPVSAHVQRCMC
jgi:hypothetical protein